MSIHNEEFNTLPVIGTVSVTSYYEPQRPLYINGLKTHVTTKKESDTFETYQGDLKNGTFLRSLCFDKEFFMIGKTVRLGYLMRTLLKSFNVSKPRLGNKKLIISYSNDNGELSNLSSNCIGSLELFDTPAEAKYKFNRIISICQIVKAHSKFLLANVPSKEMENILLDYVTNVNVPLNTLRSNILHLAKK